MCSEFPEMIAGAPARFQVLVGSAPTVYPALTVGARGAILALASALPEKCATLYQYFKQGQLDKAKELQRSLLRASKLIVSEIGIAGVKYVMDRARLSRRNSPAALASLSAEQKSKLAAFLATLEQPIMASA